MAITSAHPTSNLSDSLQCQNKGITDITGVGALTTLKTLQLQYNALSSIPDEIGDMTSLQVLYLWNNQLTSLPSGLARATDFQEQQIFAF